MEAVMLAMLFSASTKILEMEHQELVLLGLGS